MFNDHKKCTNIWVSLFAHTSISQMFFPLTGSIIMHCSLQELHNSHTVNTVYISSFRRVLVGSLTRLMPINLIIKAVVLTYLGTLVERSTKCIQLIINRFTKTLLQLPKLLKPGCCRASCLTRTTILIISYPLQLLLLYMCGFVL